MKMNIYLIAALSILLASCGGSKLLNKPVIKPKKLDANSFYIVPTDASLKTNLISTKADGSFRMITEVSPDAMVSSVVNLTTKLGLYLKKGDSLSAQQVASITQSVVQLGKRTAAVNILRDALFRLEEINQNRDISKPMDTSSYNIFMQVLNNVKEISLAEAKEAEAVIQKAAADTVKAIEKTRQMKIEAATQTEILNKTDNDLMLKLLLLNPQTTKLDDDQKSEMKKKLEEIKIDLKKLETTIDK